MTCSSIEVEKQLLTCGPPVESTVYDFLEGLARRKEHKHFPEPGVIKIFKKNPDDMAININEVEAMLKNLFIEV